MLSAEQVNKVISKKIKDVKDDVIYVLAIRGNQGPNKIGTFDDRCYVVFDHALKGTWAMNTDPSNNNKVGRATLTTGVWLMQAKKHHINDSPPIGRAAFGQAQAVTVSRYKQGMDTGWFGINIHNTLNDDTTSSEGCQTFQSNDWSNSKGTGFRDVMYRILKLTPEKVMANPGGVGDKFYYILCTGDEVNALLA